MYKSHRKKKKRGKTSSGQQHQQRSKQGKENERPRVQYSSDSYDSEDEKQKVKDTKKTAKENGESNKLAYEIKDSDVMGRYLVSSRDLKAGELIIEAEPLAVGPCTGCTLICLGCYHPITESRSRCRECNWPLCGDKCPGLHRPLGHSLEECSILKEHTEPDYTNIPDLKESYQAIVPLRCLLLKSHDPEKWETLHTMVAHNDIRRKKIDLWRHNQITVVDRIRKRWGLLEYTEDEIHTVCGILEVNAFEVGPTGISIRGLYPEAFLLAHDCTPNTTHTDDVHRILTIRAATRIPKGEAITLSYAYTLQCTFKRREHLKESKFFDCVCLRCRDPTELGTYAGALVCPKCASGDIMEKSNLSDLSDRHLLKNLVLGSVIPTAPLDNSAPWRCDTCSEYIISASSVRTLIQKLNDEYDKIDVNDVEEYESFLSRYKHVLHPNNYLFLSIKHSLSQLYGKVDSYLIHEMPLTLLERKRDICRDIIKVFDILEPGLSRLRGVTLYELHAPLMIITTRSFEQKKLNKQELRGRLKEVVKCLEEAWNILSLEPKNSSEGIMATASKDALGQIKDWEKIIGKII